MRTRVIDQRQEPGLRRGPDESYARCLRVCALYRECRIWRGMTPTLLPYDCHWWPAGYQPRAKGTGSDQGDTCHEMRVIALVAAAASGAVVAAVGAFGVALACGWRPL